MRCRNDLDRAIGRQNGLELIGEPIDLVVVDAVCVQVEGEVQTGRTDAVVAFPDKPLVPHFDADGVTLAGRRPHSEVEVDVSSPSAERLDELADLS